MKSKTALTFALVFATAFSIRTNLTQAQQDCSSTVHGRLLVPGPGGDSLEISAFDLATGQRSTFATLPMHPYAMTLGQDGLLYVADHQTGTAIYKLDRHTGAIVESVPIAPYYPLFPYGIVRKPNGNLLLLLEDPNGGLDKIHEYAADGSFLGVWLDGLDVGRNLALSPSGTIVLTTGHPGNGPTRLVEYDLSGNFIRELIPASFNVWMYGTVFGNPNEIIISDNLSSCIKRFDYPTTGPANFLNDCGCDYSSIGGNNVAWHPLNGSVFATGGRAGCIVGWDAACNPLYGGQPLAPCSAPFSFGIPIIIAEDCNNNGLEDRCEIESGQTPDCNGNLIPDACESDSDGDGTIDACDGCPNDPNKTAPGVCGCGVADTIGFVGFLPPIGGADVTGGSFADPLRAYKLGSTIPAKFAALQCGSPLLTGIHTLQAVKYSSAVDSEPAIDATPTDAATTGNQFLLTDGQWHFNLSTRSGFSAGTWKLIATLSDGSTHYVWITIKK